MGNTTTTNEQNMSTQTCPIDCKDIWSQMQSHSYRQVSVRYADLGAKKLFVNRDYYGLPGEDDDLVLRAKRIAGIYARLYLETQTTAGNGDPSKKGRFYWMALGAFAGKTVKCTLDGFLSNTAPGILDHMSMNGRNAVKTAMGKGNLWLFLEMAPWHLFFVHHRSCFEQCIGQRAVPSNLLPPIQEATYKIAWVQDALPVLNQMRVTDEVREAFKKSAQIEITTDPDARRGIQLEHLNKLVTHEQNNILQKLIYTESKNADFLWWVRRQRGLLGMVAPDMALVFSHACSINDPELKSVAPKDLVLEDYDSRSAWIRSAVGKFHKLMGERTAYMEQELRTIASWWTPG